MSIPVLWVVCLVLSVGGALVVDYSQQRQGTVWSAWMLLGILVALGAPYYALFMTVVSMLHLR